jgi:hypothetical protein
MQVVQWQPAYIMAWVNLQSSELLGNHIMTFNLSGDVDSIQPIQPLTVRIVAGIFIHTDSTGILLADDD